MKLNKIGYGTWPLGGIFNGSLSYGKVNDEDSIQALLKAYNMGVNVYDTSDFYGFGHVESLLGKVFENNRNNIYIITKGGMTTNDGQQNFEVDYITKTFMSSLNRLKTNYVDVYMLHSPKSSMLKESNLVDHLKSLKNDGLIKKIGISLAHPNDGIEAIEKYGFEVVEVNYNILDRRAESNGLLEYCSNHNILNVIRTPLAQGILSGKFKFNNDSDDRRQSWSPNKVDNFVRIYKKMLSKLNDNQFTDSQNCLRFCLSNPNVNVIIPGMKVESEVIENVSTLNLPPLTEKEKEDILNIYTEEKL
jgi:aryl-alcohol dehydrogenase-like predicted oxidoreductase